MARLPLSSYFMNHQLVHALQINNAYFHTKLNPLVQRFANGQQ
jgi:hypothetical protein